MRFSGFVCSVLAIFLLSGTACTVAEVSTSWGTAEPSGDVAPSLELVWLGGPTTLIKFNGVTILTDPTLGEADFIMGDPNEMFDISKAPNIIHHKRLVPLPDFDLASIDFVLLSHAHEDHLDQGAVASLKSGIAMIAPPHDEARLKGYGFTSVETLDWRQQRTILAGRGEIIIEAVRADHSRNDDINTFLGRGNGYWIRFVQGDWQKTLYWTGDSFPTPRVLASVEGFDAPDVLMAHMGSVGFTGALGQLSMGAEGVAIFEESIRPDTIVPIHHSTYDLYLKPVVELEAVRDQFNGTLIYPDPGRTIRLDQEMSSRCQ
jgi:N-acyl-phosphatidylethanolamine-hydrolysing phospholipase D